MIKLDRINSLDIMELLKKNYTKIFLHVERLSIFRKLFLYIETFLARKMSVSNMLE